jgi:uncharacterized protein
MECPRCKKPLVILEFEKVEIDYCLSCEGVWLDSGELELLLGTSGEKKILLSTDAKSDEPPLKCPKCRKKMEKVGSIDGVLLDRCKYGHGLWFDSGELEAILRGNKIDSESRISEHLRGIFRNKTKSLDKGEPK